MRFGLCCGMDDAEAALEAGFDYVELPASQLLQNESRYAALRPEATNLFFPGTIRLFGPDRTSFLDYAQSVVEGASRVGVRTMVIGSGGARKAPEGTEPDEAEAGFIRVAAEITDLAEPYGIIVAPESLNRTETNVGNRLGKLATNLRTAGVAFTADSYHVITEWILSGNEQPPPIEHWRDEVPYLPAHVHLGGRDRVDPLPNDPDIAGFVMRLFELGYDGRVSLECSRRPNQPLSKSLSDVKALFA
jgi:sugar phosphate isomerase/epimerase